MTPHEAPAIAFERVGKRYADGTTALNDVSFEIPRGEFCVVLGPSGSGKSTLLRSVNGLVTPSMGEVRIGGLAISNRNLKQIRRRIGTIYQQFNLVERASVAFNVISGALPAVAAWRAWLGIFPAESRARACELLAQAGLKPEHLTRRISELSGGQQQRVGIARAMMLHPDIIIADEPVASLDPRISADILSLIRTQARENNATVLCSLHQPELAREFADRVIGLQSGKVVFDGPPTKLATLSVARIYSSPAATGGSPPERMAS